ncbi:bifunctional hydroxymethylpyrimidine kinase/phosphomethylpyrimidine kinase [Aeromicrobium sp. Marseille-Q0843]|uniref:Bifunctional hydroxymethylpyrimidine kinase/phosphomethylpyrimidine kinase n=1 Tax=Aeromicrobium phoceense TaxID=2754045 RepID=A0A838XSJ8_9ACTN|nr:bifunctional hydroxymethylpyrimidine kinase/phosphomethylpyrimidine kinase [Aeromicrobium phoceense]MBA4609880.1 bifunctional hydroxymethylpyrimidine kinase/phosphomethylpyrimidine kinase [Aeromicrobium phoceense]
MSGGSSVPRVLAIAGTDPTGGAGIQADLKSIAASGGYGMAVVTALVAQNTRGVRSVHVPPTDFLAEQLDAVSEDVTVDAVKIGMLAGREVIETVGAWLRRTRPPVVVIDPVMIATSGDRLLDADAEQALRELLPLAHLITPNVAELAVLAGRAPAARWPDVLEQAREVSATHDVVVLAKGGHVEGDAVPDALVDGGGTRLGGREVVEFPGARIATTNTHGTGCSLSSAVATHRARLGSWEPATAEAKRWLTESIRHGASLEVGGGNGPISHFAGMWSRGGTATRPTAEEVRDQWWDGVRDVRAAIAESAFVRGLADGSLSKEAFGVYLAQDALYLRDYARVLSEASRLAPTLDEQSFWAAGAHGALVTELQLHADWLGDMEPPPPGPATTAYLDHLLATAARGDHRVLAAAVLPCYWIYADLGRDLQARAVDGHPYQEWLRTYGDPAFAEATARAIDITTELATSADDVTREAMWHAFRVSAEHELAFFEAPLRMTGPVPS